MNTLKVFFKAFWQGVVFFSPVLSALFLIFFICFIFKLFNRR